MELAQARVVARRLAHLMAPHCERVEVAGSVRRGKLQVKDLELVAVPKWADETNPADLFGGTVCVNLLHRWALRAGGIAAPEKAGKGEPLPDPLATVRLEWIKTGTPYNERWTPAEDGKYWRAWLPEHGVRLDLFLAEPENFGAIHLIRTGSAEFAQAVMVHAQRVGFRFQDGHLWRGSGKETGRRVPVREEADVFDALNLVCPEPAMRRGPDDVRTNPVRKSDNAR